MKKKAVFLGLAEMGALLGYVFAAVLFGIFIFGVKGCTVVSSPTILQNISGVDMEIVRSDYEIISMMQMPAAGDMNTADRIVWSIVNDDYLLLKNQLNNLYSNGDDYWKIWDATVTNNVITDLGISDPTGRGIAWGFYLSFLDDSDVTDNLVINSDSGVWNTIGIYAKRVTRNTNFADNIIYNIPSGEGVRWEGDTDSNGSTPVLVASGNAFTDNYFQIPTSCDYLFRCYIAINGTATFTNSVYYGSSGSGTDLSAFSPAASDVCHPLQPLTRSAGRMYSFHHPVVGGIFVGFDKSD